MTLEPPGSHFYLGLDLGQARDYSAIAVAERRVDPTGLRDPITYLHHTVTRIFVRHLERIPLRTPYPEVVERVRSVVQRFSGTGLQAGPNLQIVMDATGVGAAVKDMLRVAKLGVSVYGVIITGAQHVSISHGDYHVPRHDLLCHLRVLLEKRMLKIGAKGPFNSALRLELNRWGNRSAHDDLVFALALACWKAGGLIIPTYSSGPLPMIHPEVRK